MSDAHDDDELILLNLTIVKEFDRCSNGFKNITPELVIHPDDSNIRDTTYRHVFVL
jgi:hypothetical protein